MYKSGKTQVYEYLDSLSQKELEIIKPRMIRAQLPHISIDNCTKSKSTYFKENRHITRNKLPKVNNKTKYTANKYNIPQNTKLPHIEPADDASDSSHSGGGLDLISSPFIREILSIQSSFVHSKLPCSVKDAIDLRTAAQLLEGGKDMPPWSIPFMISDKRDKNLYDPTTYERIVESTDWPNANPGLVKRGITKQVLIMKVICDPSIEIVAVEAAKRHGKSTCAWTGICQGAWENIFKNIGLWASGEENAIGILADVFRDEISVMETMPLFKGQGSAKQKVFYNNAIIKAFSNNAARTSGLDFDLCWIDEAHEVVVEHKEVFDMIIMTMRAKPQIKLLITMNKGTGTYHIFKDTLEKEFGREVVFLTIEDGDISHITLKADKKVRTLVQAVGGKDEVTRWLDNKVSNFGTFDQQSVREAYSTYHAWLMENHQPHFAVVSFDPSGSGHPMGWSAWACDRYGMNFWQLGGGELQLGDTLEDFKTGDKLTPEQIRIYMKEKCYTYLHSLPRDQTYFISESNMNGKEMKVEMALAGYRSMNQNFSTDKNQKKGASRGAMCLLTRAIMDDRSLFINNELLRNEWLIYAPDEHEKTAKYKGDIADSAIQGLYRLAKMSKSAYLRLTPKPRMRVIH